MMFPGDKEEKKHRHCAGCLYSEDRLVVNYVYCRLFASRTPSNGFCRAHDTTQATQKRLAKYPGNVPMSIRKDVWGRAL